MNTDHKAVILQTNLPLPRNIWQDGCWNYNTILKFTTLLRRETNEQIF